jgi:glycosyltransferase involved in cell wall biosynthesis
MDPVIRSGISVLLPVKNGGEWLSSAIRSILNQSRCADEVLIVDDGSSDNSMEIVDQLLTPRIRVVRGPQKGLAAALQVGLLECRYDLVARMDQDDVSHPARLESQERYLRRHSAMVACGSWARALGSADRRRLIRTPTHPPDIRLLLGLYNPLIHSSVTFRRSAVLKVGGYMGPSVRAYPEDYDLWLRLAEVGLIGGLKQALVAYRVHPHSISRIDALQLANDSYDLALQSTGNLAKTSEELKSISAVLGWLHRQSGPQGSSVQSLLMFLRTVQAISSQTSNLGAVSVETRLRLAHLALKFSLAGAKFTSP